MPSSYLLSSLLALSISTSHGFPLVEDSATGILTAARSDSLSYAFQDGSLRKREDSPTDVCKRWSQQTAVVNGTMYIYGGRSTTEASQDDDTWNNDFLTLDLTKTWSISSPTLKGLAKPSGPPPVSNGYLWNSYESLFLYGGEFSDKPVTSPVPFSLWEYSISSSSWKEHKDPQTTAGHNSKEEDQPVQRSAEGAGITIPGLGRGWYFGGHLDGYTTAGWSQSIPRVYLKSMIEYTFPGHANKAVDSLEGGDVAGEDGVWRNITEGGLQDSAGFTERADGVLVYVPGFSEDGIILGLGGGTNETFTQMNVIDIYDIATSTWYKQATTGDTPKIRVNPCAVAASAEDGSSTQIYLYGGQNLIPFGEQIQYDDMWILTIPSFTWIQVDMKGQSNPPARAGHTCNIWNSQMIVTGGYVGQDLSCDSPGVYVFDTSELSWKTEYAALEGSNDLNQHPAQEENIVGLGGSYGYRVPKPVQSVIGGDERGRATVTAPAVDPTGGPLATGQPLTYNVPDSGETGSGGGIQAGNGRNVAAIIAGVIAGCFAILAAYLGFCAYVYRRQLKLYKAHVAATQRFSTGSQTTHAEKTSFFNRFSADWSATAHSTAGTSSRPGTAMYSAHPNGEGGDGNSTANSSVDDLLAGQEPTFLGVMLNPRRSLRVINKD
ncbi:hypothetical protein FQN54_009457 [Arachnomyces sp. PD_36]|nr:hypothetical protein FQN54_009457 [Arachnomyces sp. PD_36]